MRKLYTTLFSLAASATAIAQSDMSFEPGGFGAGYAWNVFENDTNPALEFVENPDPTGVNTSTTVAKFRALVSGQPWAGCETQQPGTNPWEGGPGMGNWVLTPENAIIKIMVYKKAIGDVGIKLVTPGDDARPEKKVSNTLINQWEELTFDFTDVINHPNMPAGNVFNQIVIFPDFRGRETDVDVYFDNIVFGTNEIAGTKDISAAKVNLYPNPVKDVLNLKASSAIETVTIYNMLGQEVAKAMPGAEAAEVNVSHLQKGVYVVSTVANGVSASQKIIKE